jgi:succinate dehydrogenase / fumarate reductase, iron-sulfur subunit
VAFREGVSWADRGARHARAFLASMRQSGKLNETLLVPFTDPVGAPLDAPFALRMAAHRKVPAPFGHKIKQHDEVKKLLKNVKETV